MSIHVPFAIALSVSLGWTVLFSLSNTPGVRGYRNFGILEWGKGLTGAPERMLKIGSFPRMTVAFETSSSIRVNAVRR